MKIEQIRARIQEDMKLEELTRPDNQPKGKLLRLLPAKTQTAQVLDGEVEAEKTAPTTISLDDDESDLEYFNDLDYSLSLLANAKNLMEYLHDAKLNSVIEPIDRKEMRNLVNEIDVFIRSVLQETDSLNVGMCKNYVHSSCLQNNLSARTTCSSCKKYQEQIAKRARKHGILLDTPELNERDMKTLETIQEGLANRGVDI